MYLLKDKNILLGVSASISIYKALELIRLYIKAGADVKVIMTPSAVKFISTLTFETISQNTVLIEDKEDWTTQTDNNHIAIGKWADIFVIAPASANTINKLAHGIADNLLLQTALAYPHTKLLCPAANTQMMENPLTKASLEMLKLCKFKLVHTQIKELACKDIGDGALARIEDIFHTTAKELLQDEYWNHRKVVLTGGGTIEKIDEVRYISNFSSGKMASSLALALYYKGAECCLISSKIFDLPKDISNVLVTDTNEMNQVVREKIKQTKSVKNSLENSIQKKAYFFSVAAVSDFTPNAPQNGKIKKEDIGNTWELKLKKNMDILANLPKENIFTVGFKAELDESRAYHNAKAMLKAKNLDAVCLNILEENNTFGSSNNTIELITKDNSIHIPLMSKLELSLKLLDHLKEQFSE
jgi:phosphopantothenoylcysteine decarboxylase/phosphopantothenate--cysteine ligase